MEFVYPEILYTIIAMKSSLSPTKVYNLLKLIPRGRVTTYKAIAQACNSKAYRAVGQILKNNPGAPRVPCHRVVTSEGKIGGYNGSHSSSIVSQKIALLNKEGVIVHEGKVAHFNKLLFIFD